MHLMLATDFLTLWWIPFTVAEEEIVVAEDFEYFLALLEGEGQADHWSVSESDWKLRKAT